MRQSALKPRQICETRFFLNQRRRLRDHALFDLAIDSKLRGCDVGSLKIDDLVSGGQDSIRALVVERKTGRLVQFEALADARASPSVWLGRRGDTLSDFVCQSHIDHTDHLSTRQYARPVDEWVQGIGVMREKFGTHSLRRTKASIKQGDRQPSAVQILLGRTKIENPVRYLSVDIEDALALATGTKNLSVSALGPR